MDLYSSSAQSSTKLDQTGQKHIHVVVSKLDEYKPKQRLQNELFVSPNRVSITRAQFKVIPVCT